uniref:Uncharacterized protein n=1 Tax=Setaria italica TaxID=4555 RepID=K3XTQ6_SETIT
MVDKLKLSQSVQFMVDKSARVRRPVSRSDRRTRRRRRRRRRAERKRCILRGPLG